ncbi:MAG: type II secretion system protein J, partial [Pseudobdellovibrionaceae bacterium]
MKKNLRNNKGFTVTELMVALGLSVILGMMTVGFQLDMKRSVQKLEDRADFVTDANTGLRIVWDMLGKMKPSFNNLTLGDDDGRNFFDMATDMNIPGSGGAVMSRKFTLNFDRIDNGRTEFVFLADEPKRGAGVLYNP